MSNFTPQSTSQPLEIAAESAQPLNKFDEVLRENFAKDFAEQSARLDDLAKQLITLEIAIPGIYAAILKLVSGDKATTRDATLTIVAFAIWLLALALSLTSLIPLRRQVDLDNLTDIQNYFGESARRKRSFLIPASVLTFLGIFIAALVIFM